MSKANLQLKVLIKMDMATIKKSPFKGYMIKYTKSKSSYWVGALNSSKETEAWNGDPNKTQRNRTLLKVY